MRINVLHVTPQLNLAGAQVHALNICRFANSELFSMHICALTPLKGTLESNFRELGVPVAHIDAGPKLVALPIRSVRYLRSLETPVDVIHVHDMVPQSLCVGVIARAMGIPGAVFTIHGRSRFAPSSLKGFVIRKLVAWLDRCYDRRIALSKAVKRFWIQEYGTRSESIEAIPNGVDPERFRPARTIQRSRLPKNVRVIGTVGNLKPVKGHSYMIDAMPTILNAFPDVYLVIVGQGISESSLYEQIQARGLSDHVMLLGKRLDVDELLREFDLFVLPSLSEGLPTALLEAMASGLPVVASNVSGVPEIIRHGENGLLVEPGSAEGLAEAVKGLLRDLELSVRLGRNARATAVVVTFDDGYADNLHNAKTLLERYDAPATVFVITGYMGRRREFWWDELERLLIWTPKLPECLQVMVNSAGYEWHLGDWAQLPEDAKRSYGQWHVELSDNPTSRHRAYRELHRLLRSLAEEEQETVLAQLRAQSKDEGSGRTDYRPMTPEEVRRLADSGLVDVGAHTETHPVLVRQPLEMQQKEITESKRHLVAILGRPVTAFSYPYGGQGDIGQDAVRLVREAGYEVACANFPSRVTHRSDSFFLPRYVVRDWDGEEFARSLRRFFHASP